MVQRRPSGGERHCLTLGRWKIPDIIDRSLIFVMLGASGFAPIIHTLVSDHMSLADFPLFHIITSSVLYLIGTIFYVSRTPEKHWPGMFNVWVSESCRDHSNNANSVFSGCKPSNLSYPYQSRSDFFSARSMGGDAETLWRLTCCKCIMRKIQRLGH